MNSALDLARQLSEAIASIPSAAAMPVAESLEESGVSRVAPAGRGEIALAPASASQSEVAGDEAAETPASRAAPLDQPVGGMPPVESETADLAASQETLAGSQPVPAASIAPPAPAAIGSEGKRRAIAGAAIAAIAVVVLGFGLAIFNSTARLDNAPPDPSAGTPAMQPESSSPTESSPPASGSEEDVPTMTGPVEGESGRMMRVEPDDPPRNTSAKPASSNRAANTADPDAPQPGEDSKPKSRKDKKSKWYNPKSWF
jgi:hypothetical protein